MATAKIPQDVTREDRLFGPLTLRQFLALLLASGLIFVVYQGYASQYLYFAEFAILSSIIGIIALAWAFAKINGRPFPIFLVNLLHFMSTPKQWGWVKEDLTTMAPIKISAADIKSTRTEVTERKSGKVVKMQIEQLANVLDTGGTMNTGRDAIVDSQVRDMNAPAIQVASEPLDVEDILSEVD